MKMPDHETVIIAIFLAVAVCGLLWMLYNIYMSIALAVSLMRGY